MGSACQSQASATWLVRRGGDWAAAGLRRWRERARWAEVRAGVAGPAGRGWAGLGWVLVSGWAGFWVLLWVFIFLFYFLSKSNSNKVRIQKGI